MKTTRHIRIQTGLLAAFMLTSMGCPTLGAEAGPADKGLSVFSAGHSFHMFMPKMLADLARAAKVSGHQQAGVSSIGGSYVHQHWDVADEKNTLKKALRDGRVDVLTLSPIYLPDDGIENLARLGLEHRPDIRVTIQEFWLPYDVLDLNYKKQRPAPVDRNSRTAAEMRAIHEPYFRSMDDHVRALNQKFGRQVLLVVPAGQAALALRTRIIEGRAPGLKQQDDLFTDAIGHATPPLQWLTAYCHFAVIYRRPPAGLPCPPALAREAHGEALNRLLQELAWEAVKSHPLSGIQAR
ncbi:MAG: hypothetical protein CJBNEKGG_03820 [Prosthecobacter sp.]|nr:hypothetical protein [Prosthecobacter sp.]